MRHAHLSMDTPVFGLCSQTPSPLLKWASARSAVNSECEIALAACARIQGTCMAYASLTDGHAAARC